MTARCVRITVWAACCCLMSLGCASQQMQPSLWDRLSGKKQQGLQGTYLQEPEEDLNSKKIEDPTRLKVLYAQLMEEMKNYPEARLQYSTILGEKPENFDAIIGLARIDQEIGQPDKAEAGFRKALALKPDSPTAQHALGQFYLNQGRVSDAIPLLNKALLQQPNDKSFRYDFAVALAKSGDVNAALPHFKRTVGEAAAYHNVATILRDRGDIKEAEQYYRLALSIQPDLEESRQALAALYRQQQPQHIAGSPNGGAVVQGVPNQSVVPAAHLAPPVQNAAIPQSPSTSPSTQGSVTQPATSASPVQLQFER